MEHLWWLLLYSRHTSKIIWKVSETKYELKKKQLPDKKGTGKDLTY